MGKRKLEIKKIEDKNKRQVCFSKRRKGLFTQASNLRTLCDAHVAIIAFSGAGKPFVSGHPNVDAVIDHYLGTLQCSTPHMFMDSSKYSELYVDTVSELERQLINGVTEYDHQLPKNEADHGGGLLRSWLDVVFDVEGVAHDIEGLKQLKHRMERLREKLQARLDDIYFSTASSSAAAAACSNSTDYSQVINPESQQLIPLMADEDIGLFYNDLPPIGVTLDYLD